MAKREFIGYFKPTGEKVYRVEVPRLGITEFQTQNGKKVPNTEIDWIK